MTNRVTLIGTLVGDPKIRSFEAKGGTIEIVSLWIEAPSGERQDRFTIEINCPKAGQAAKAMREGVRVEVEGVLRHDRWKIKGTDKWTGKVFVAIDPAAGAVRSLGIAEDKAAA
jgi:single-stranded DNA-binding protein